MFPLTGTSRRICLFRLRLVGGLRALEGDPDVVAPALLGRASAVSLDQRLLHRPGRGSEEVRAALELRPGNVEAKKRLVDQRSCLKRVAVALAEFR